MCYLQWNVQWMGQQPVSGQAEGRVLQRLQSESGCQSTTKEHCKLTTEFLDIDLESMMAPVNKGGKVLKEVSLISCVFITSEDGLILLYSAT